MQTTYVVRVQSVSIAISSALAVHDVLEAGKLWVSTALSSPSAISPPPPTAVEQVEHDAVAVCWGAPAA